MGKKTLILSQKQLDEISGGNSAYLDNISNDFAENGSNEVFVGEKNGKCDAEPMVTDKFSKSLTTNNGFTGYGGHGRDFTRMPLFFESKKEWVKKNLNEEYTDPTMTSATFATGKKDKNGNVEHRNLGSMKTQKMRFGAAQAKANSSDPTLKKQGEATMKTMLKNDPNLSAEIQQYGAKQKSAEMSRKAEKETLGTPILNRNKPSQGNGKAHTNKDNLGIITYDN